MRTVFAFRLPASFPNHPLSIAELLRRMPSKCFPYYTPGFIHPSIIECR